MIFEPLKIRLVASSKNIIKEVVIEKIAAEGKCLVHWKDRVIFVEGFVAPGDCVDLYITKRKKSFWLAKAIHFHQFSEQRTEPFCKHFGVCGGCKWQHLPYEIQLAYKQEQVEDQLKRIGKVNFPEIRSILPSPQSTYYRNKLEFTFTNLRWLTQEEIAEEQKLNRNGLGFHIPKRFDKILDIDHCYLQQDPSNTIRLSIKQYADEHNLSYFDLITQEGWLRNLVIRISATGQVMVMLIFAYEDEISRIQLLDFLLNKHRIDSLYYVINHKKNDTIFDLEPQLYSGEKYILEQMGELQFQVGPKSFYQVNAEQAHRLYQVALDFADLQGNELVYDLYTGTGTIANFIARKAHQVIGIDTVEEAIIHARENARINQIENSYFVAGMMKDIFTMSFLKEMGRPEVIITDPPRSGMHPDVIRVILQVLPAKIVYISCNPATQARDIAMLSEKYNVTAIQPVDMFPHTYHVENVVKLELNN